MTPSQSKTSPEAGFSLVEAAVALFISVLLFTMLGLALGVGFRSAHDSRVDQQGTSLAVEYVELSRSYSWDELAMTASIAGDPRLIDTPEKLRADAMGIAPPNEVLVISPSGLVAPMLTETVDDTDFTVWQYVTQIDSELKRYVVFVTWEGAAGTREHHTSTVVAENRELTG